MLAGYHPRPLISRLASELAAGRVGQVRAVSMRLCFMGGVYPGFEPTSRWRSEIPSGELTTIGSHAFVTLFRLVNDRIRAVYAVLRNQFYDSYRAVGAEDWAEVNLQFASGAVANVLVTRLPYRIADEDILIEVTGTDGYAQVSRNKLTLWPGEEIVTLPMDGAAALAETFRSFYAAIESGGPMPTSFDDGRRLHVPDCYALPGHSATRRHRDITSGKQEIVEALIYTALLTMAVSRTIQNLLEVEAQQAQNADQAERHFPLLRLAAVLRDVAHKLLETVLKEAGVPIVKRSLWEIIRDQAADPNRSRKLLLHRLHAI